ncbi:endospore germination permease [Lentibacillus sp. N15]|uniref:GerAB/ArcD/ProY family transporter n=1 Tax=Lentibacillus songyuanensis TaxID=3136161 RepID=UPI0031BB1894
MLTKWETLSLIIMTLPIMGHVVLLPVLLDITGRDAWISAILSAPAGFLFIVAIYRLRSKYPKQPVSDIFKQILGPFFGTIMMIIFIVYFLFLTIFSFSILVDFVYIAFFPETPRIAILIWFLIFFIYAALKSIKRIALTASVLTLIAAILGPLITFLSTPHKDWSQLLPIFEYGFSPTLFGALLLVNFWIELLFLLCVPVQYVREKGIFLYWTIGIALNLIMILSTSTGVITIFGINSAGEFTYPALNILRVISFGFIDRFDIYALLLLCLGVYIRCSLFFRIAYTITTTKISSKWIKCSWFTGFILLIVPFTYYITEEHFRVDFATNIYAYTFVLYPIPFLLLGISYIRGKV